MPGWYTNHTMAQLKAKLIEIYDEDDKNYAEKAMAEINDYYAKMPKSTSKIDPDRLGSRSTVISRLKMAILEKLGFDRLANATIYSTSRQEDITQRRFRLLPWR